MDERWRPAPGFERGYLVSDMGRVRRRAGLYNGRFRQALQIKPDPDNYGYPKVNLFDASNRGRTVYVHRLVALAFCGNDDPGRKTEVDHVNGDHLDARASNLEWVTPAENVRRAREAGLTARRLTPEQVRRIRRDPRPPGRIARDMGLSFDAVRAVKLNRTWREGR